MIIIIINYYLLFIINFNSNSIALEFAIKNFFFEINLQTLSKIVWFSMFRVKNSSQKPSCPAPRPNEDKRLISNRKKRNTFKQNRNLITKKNSDTRKGYKYEAIDKKIVVFSLCRCIVKTCLVKTKRVILRLKSKIANFFFSFFSSKFNRIFFLSH